MKTAVTGIIGAVMGAAVTYAVMKKDEIKAAIDKKMAEIRRKQREQDIADDVENLVDDLTGK